MKLIEAIMVPTLDSERCHAPTTNKIGQTLIDSVPADILRQIISKGTYKRLKILNTRMSSNKLRLGVLVAWIVTIGVSRTL